MSASFQTNKLKSRRVVDIDGHTYTVRRFGNIEQMEVSRLQSEIQKVLKKYPEDVKDTDISEADRTTLNDKSEESSKLIVRLFDDGTEEQEKSKALVASLTDEDIFDMLGQIFAEK